MKKRILSTILALAMVVSMFAGISVFASAQGSYVKATEIAAGDTVVLVCEDAGMELEAFSETSTIYGIGIDADTNMLTGYVPFVVEAGAAEGSYALKTGESYLNWTKGNSINLSDTVSENSSWTIAFDENGNATLTNVYNTARVIWWNVGSPRFATYEGKTAGGSFYNVQLYKLDANACAHGNASSEITTAPTCDAEGVSTWTCPDCGETWTAAEPATGHSFDEGTVTVAATCEADGELTKTCALCSATDVSVIPATGHDYADGVCTVCGALDETGSATYVKATSIAVGDQVVLVCEDAAVELEAISTTSTKYGIGAAIEESVVTGVMALEVVAGANEGTYAFKNGEKYLVWTSGNSLNLSDSLDANSSWTVTFDENGNALIANVADSGRIIWWNKTSPRFACYARSTSSNQYLSTQLYVKSEGACAHSNASSEITTPASCEADGVMTWNCADCGESWTTIIDALGHSYSLSVVDGSVVMACSVCSASEAVALNTIAEAKAYTDTSVVYNVKGIVTYVSGRNVYIEDENDGLCVYFPADFDTSAISLGEEIYVSATMTAYKGLLELNGPTEYYVLSTGNNLPNNSDVTLADLLADTTNTYLGERVTLSGLTIGTINANGNTTLTDEAGNSISLYKASGLAEDVTEGDTVTVTAIVSTYNGYQLIVNPGTIATDVTVTEEGTEEEVTTITIAEAKAGTAGEYYQVEGIVTYMTSDNRTIYIQDATGGIALYLTAKPSEPVCAIGDAVRAYGAWKNYNGLIELTNIDAADPAFFQVLSSANTVEAQKITITDLTVDFDKELLSEKVLIEGAAIVNVKSDGTVTLKQGKVTTTIYKAPVLAELCVPGAIVNVEAVVSCYNVYQLLVTDASAVSYVGPCAHENTTVVEGTAASCTADGLTDGAVCDLCEQTAVAQEIIPATGHSYGFTNNGDETHTALCEACSDTYTEPCSYVDGACSDCSAKEPSAEPTVVSIKISHSLNLASDITLNYVVASAALADYDSFYMECVMPEYEGNEQVGSKTVRIEPTVNAGGNMYYFVLTGVTAVRMNDMIEAKLYLTKGTESFVSEADLYSVGTYAYSQLNKTTSTDALKALCADLLRYGAAAQTFKGYRTDALVDAAMTDEMKAYMTDIETVTFGNNKSELTDCENPTVLWKGRTLALDSKVTLMYVIDLNGFAGNKEDLSLRVSFVNMSGETETVTLTEMSEYSAGSGWYAFSFDGLLASELRTVLTAAVYEGETQVSNSSIFSIDTYGNGKTGTLLDLCKSLMAYSDTALAFFQ